MSKPCRGSSSSGAAAADCTVAAHHHARTMKMPMMPAPAAMPMRKWGTSGAIALRAQEAARQSEIFAPA